MSEISFIILGGLLLIAVRCWAIHLFRWFFRIGIVGDAAIHYSIIRQLRKDPKSRYVEQFLISPEPMSYPILFHKIARFFPLRLIERFPFLPSLAIYAASSFLFLCYLVYLRHAVPGTGDLFLAAAFLVYLVSPSLLYFGETAVNYIGLSERTLARASCSMAYAATAMWLLHSDWVSFCVALVCGVAVLSCSIFGRQALLFALPLVSVLSLDWRPIGLLVLMFLGAWLAGGEYFPRSFKHTITHWFCYVRYTKKQGGKLVQVNLTRYFNWEFPNGVTPREILRNVIYKDPTRTLFVYPEMLLLVLLIVKFGDVDPLSLAFAPALLATIVVYFTTLTEKFNHVGEAYRYIEYNFLYLMPIAAGLLLDRHPGAWSTTFLTLYVVCCMAASYALVFLFKNRPNPDDYKDDLSEFLDKLDIGDNAVIYPITMRTGADIVVRRPGWKTFWWQPELQLPSIFEKYIEEYPFLKKDWWPLFREHGVTHVICKKSGMRYIDWSYDFGKLRCIHDDSQYAVFEVPAAARQPETPPAPQDIAPTAEDEAFAAAALARSGHAPERTVALIPEGDSPETTYAGYAEALGLALGGQGYAVLDLSDSGMVAAAAQSLNDADIDVIRPEGPVTPGQKAALARLCRTVLGGASAVPFLGTETRGVMVPGGGRFSQMAKAAPSLAVACLPLDCHDCGWTCRYETPHCLTGLPPAVVARALLDCLDVPCAPAIRIAAPTMWKPQAGLPKWHAPQHAAQASGREIVPILKSQLPVAPRN